MGAIHLFTLIDIRAEFHFGSGYAAHSADDRPHFAVVVGASSSHRRREEEIPMRQMGVEKDNRK